MRTIALGLLTGGLLAGCGRCVERDVDSWCYHDASAKGPVVPDGAGACEPPTATPEYRCGDYDVVNQGGGFTGAVFYYDTTGALAAVDYWTDVNTYCGGYDYWYGKRIKCDRECTYEEDGGDLPVCE